VLNSSSRNSSRAANRCSTTTNDLQIQGLGGEPGRGRGDDKSAVAKGVEVTLVATLDSLTAARLDGVCATMDGRVWEALYVAHALERGLESTMTPTSGAASEPSRRTTPLRVEFTWPDAASSTTTDGSFGGVFELMTRRHPKWPACRYTRCHRWPPHVS
jgi:hypothetical protein